MTSIVKPLVVLAAALSGKPTEASGVRSSKSNIPKLGDASMKDAETSNKTPLTNLGTNEVDTSPMTSPKGNHASSDTAHRSLQNLDDLELQKPFFNGIFGALKGLNTIFNQDASTPSGQDTYLNVFAETGDYSNVFLNQAIGSDNFAALEGIAHGAAQLTNSSNINKLQGALSNLANMTQLLEKGANDQDVQGATKTLITELPSFLAAAKGVTQTLDASLNPEALQSIQSDLSQLSSDASINFQSIFQGVQNLTDALVRDVPKLTQPLADLVTSFSNFTQSITDELPELAPTINNFLQNINRLSEDLSSEDVKEIVDSAKTLMKEAGDLLKSGKTTLKLVNTVCMLASATCAAVMITCGFAVGTLRAATDASHAVKNAAVSVEQAARAITPVARDVGRIIGEAETALISLGNSMFDQHLNDDGTVEYRPREGSTSKDLADIAKNVNKALTFAVQLHNINPTPERLEEAKAALHGLAKDLQNISNQVQSSLVPSTMVGNVMNYIGIGRREG